MGRRPRRNRKQYRSPFPRGTRAKNPEKYHRGYAYRLRNVIDSFYNNILLFGKDGLPQLALDDLRYRTMHALLLVCFCQLSTRNTARWLRETADYVERCGGNYELGVWLDHVSRDLDANHIEEIDFLLDMEVDWARLRGRALTAQLHGPFAKVLPAALAEIANKKSEDATGNARNKYPG
jgi:hypothetical protein